MKIVRIEIRSFRCLRDVDVCLVALTALVGANGTGKSSVLRALEFFFGQRKLDRDDCWNGNEQEDVSVAVTFEDFDPNWADALAPHLDGYGRLRLEKRSVATPAGRREEFVVARLQLSDFTIVRAEPKATSAKLAYTKLREDPRFASLPPWTNHAASLAALDAWEAGHADQLELGEDRLSVGIGCGRHDLAPLVRLVSVPAVHDASQDAVETRAGVFRELIELLVRDRHDVEDALRVFSDEVNQRYWELVQVGGDSVLRDASAQVTKRLAALAPGTRVELSWEDKAHSFPPPVIRAQLEESGFQGDVGRQGHGVQRAYVLALLQVLTDLRCASNTPPSDKTRPLVVLAIEEPELYQHPVRARFLAGVLRKLVDPNGENATQIIYATHSPYFVSLDMIESLRLLRIQQQGDGRATALTLVDLAKAAEELWAAKGSQGEMFTELTLKPRLKALIDTPVSEGLFAAGVLLVEGDEDRALLCGAAAAKGVNFEELGIAVLPVGGKTNLDRPLLIFRQLNIPTYVCFDGDGTQKNSRRESEAQAAVNRLLLALLGAAEDDWPETQVHEMWACFENNISATVRAEFGDSHYDAALAKAQATYGYLDQSGAKNAVVVESALRLLAQMGKTSPTLDAVVEQSSRLV